mgnify:CR=1 FL=1
MKLEENLNFNDPFYQFKLFNYNKYFEYLDNLNKKKILPQVNLISGPSGYGKQTFIFHFLNHLLSSDKDDKYNYARKEISATNIDYKLMLDGIHPNFYFLDLKEKKKSIEIDQIRKLNKYLQNTSFDKEIKYIMINSCEKLNSSSSNALLKILEEPGKNNFFFLIYNNSEFLLNTIKSRCIELKIHFKDSEKKEIINELCLLGIKNFKQDFFEKEINNFYIGSPGLIFSYIKYKCESDEIKDENDKHFLLDYFVLEYLKSKENHLLKIIYLLLENIFYTKIKDNKSNIKLYVDRKNTFKKLHLMNSLNLDEKNIFQEIKGIIANV